MCGIVGIIGPGILNRHHEAFCDMLYVSGLRGLDGTGIFESSNSWKSGKSRPMTKWIKSEKSVGDFSREILYGRDSQFMNDLQGNVIIGHTRGASVGSISRENAHPFRTKKLIGVHNGTLRDAKYLIDETKTDSELFFQDMEERGIETVLSELHPDSAYAIVVQNTENGEITIARNRHRPLYIAVDRETNVVMLASESVFIEMAADHRNININDPAYFKEGYIYTLKASDVVKKRFPNWECEPIKKSNVRNRSKKEIEEAAEKKGGGVRVVYNNPSFFPEAGEFSDDPLDAMVNGKGVCGLPKVYTKQEVCKTCKKRLNLLEKYLYEMSGKECDCNTNLMEIDSTITAEGVVSQ